MRGDIPLFQLSVSLRRIQGLFDLTLDYKDNAVQAEFENKGIEVVFKRNMTVNRDRFQIKQMMKGKSGRLQLFPDIDITKTIQSLHRHHQAAVLHRTFILLRVDKVD